MADDVLQRADQMAKQGLISPQQFAQIATQYGAPVSQPDNIHTIARGPEYDKWDEALQEHGRIRIPKELDDPQKWLSQDFIEQMLKGNGIDREDRPDGSVILTRIAPTS